MYKHEINDHLSFYISEILLIEVGGQATSIVQLHHLIAKHYPQKNGNRSYVGKVQHNDNNYCKLSVFTVFIT